MLCLPNMKKYILSFVVISAFLLYSYFTRKSTIDPLLSNNVIHSGTSTAEKNSNSITATVGYKNGNYNGNVTDAFYGNIQVAAKIENGKLTQVDILQYPNDRNRSIAINSRALPILQSEAIQAQSSTVDIVSGATDTSNAFISSLDSALSQAKN
jgi:uncharacterized protein with FMN-binding domain